MGRKKGLGLKPGLWVVLAGGLLMGLPAFAQVSMTVAVPDGQTFTLTGKDMPRPDHAIVAYTRDFGTFTRTNPYGVEIVAARDPKNPGFYTVTRVTSVWECEKQQNGLANCGNAEIPENGLVLSASGDKRQPLLKALAEGQTFQLNESWFQQQTTPLTLIDPTPVTNPIGSGFPGYRASNQLIMYDKDYGSPTTGTNEFGFEVTVVDGVVVAQEGSDSRIPENGPGLGYVLSGHGRMREWLIANAPLGAKIQFDHEKGLITAITDLGTYQYQLDRKLSENEHVLPRKIRREVRHAEKAIKKLTDAGELEAATKLTVDTLEHVNRALWTKAPAFPATTIRGVWHRPVEKTATDIGRTLDTLQQAGLNTVFLETFFHGYTIFPSKTYEAYGFEKQNPKFAGVDLLQLWLEEAHKRGMKVHVWFQDFYAGTHAFQPPGPILSKYPGWANVQYSAIDKTGPTPSTLETGGYFLDPANPEVRIFLLALMDEIITRYPVDGFQLDYIRYPASFPPDRFSYLKTTWGYTTAARQAFQRETGVDPVTLTPEQTELWQKWNDYKVRQISTFVEDASRTLRRRRPEIQVSAAVFPKPEESLLMKSQDWGAWADNGWVDFLAPMTLTSAEKVVEEDARRVVTRTGGKIPVMAGVFGPFNQNTAESLLSQIRSAQQGGASGVVIFDSAHLSGRMIQALHASQVQAEEANR